MGEATMSRTESYQRAHNQRALSAAIEVAIHRACTTLDLPKGADTTRAILDSLRQVAQKHQIDLDLDVSATLGESATFPFGGKDSDHG